jgi:catechol 2,3-dioxygenase-like lactoylglutathione lyase family enzyme
MTSDGRTSASISGDTASPPRVRQLRLVVTADDYDAALTFYRDVLGLAEEESYQGDDGALVTILGAGRATLELSNPAQVRMIDAVEADGTPSARLRIAFEVDDSAAATEELVRGGAELIASPRETPWRSLNSRLDAPAGLQLTLFQELGPADGESSGATPTGTDPDTPDPAQTIGDGAA